MSVLDAFVDELTKLAQNAGYGKPSGGGGTSGSSGDGSGQNGMPPSPTPKPKTPPQHGRQPLLHSIGKLYGGRFCKQPGFINASTGKCSPQAALAGKRCCVRYE